MLTSCNDVVDNLLTRRSMTKDDIRYATPGGTLIYGTVEKVEDGLMTGLVMMLDRSADLYVSMKDRVNPFLMEIPYACGEISRFGIKYSLNGSTWSYWTTDPVKLGISSNTRAVTTNETVSIVKRSVNGRIEEITNTNIEVVYENQVYYIGRFVVIQKEGPLYGDKKEYLIRRTNCIDEDQKRFYELYPTLSNATFIQAEIGL